MSALVQTEPRAGRVARSALVMMGGLGGSMVVGLIRQRIIAIQFGTSAELDAYTAANSIPELLFTMLAGGALAFAFIPIYTELLQKRQDDPGGASELFSLVVNALFLLTGLATALVALAAPVLVRAPWGVGPNFPPEVQTLTIQLMRVLLLSTLIFVVSSIITGALYAHQHFLLPAIIPMMYSGGIILGALFLTPSMGIFGLAWGAVIGAVLHLLVQVPGLLIYKIRWRPTLRVQNPALRRVAVLMAPRVVDLLMARASIDWINANLGSGLGVGRLAALRYAFQLMNMPWTLIGTAIGIAVFPTMAELAARKDVAAQREALSGSLRAILTLALPAAAALLVLGRPTIRLLFEGGEFTAQSTEMVYYALQFYALTLISQSVLEVVVRAFAAQQDTLTPLIVSFFTTALNIGLAIWLSRPIAAGGLAHGGLALANGIAVGIESLAGLTILHVRWGGVDARRILIDAGKALVSAGAMAAAITAFRAALNPGTLVTLVGGAAIGVVVYFSLALLLGIEEVRTLPAALLRSVLRRERATA
jgi:putative peptidoglycan lipid II flippase